MATEATTKREERWPDIYCGTWWYCRDCLEAHIRDYHSHPAVHSTAPTTE